jgi:hypothetical protein
MGGCILDSQTLGVPKNVDSFDKLSDYGDWVEMHAEAARCFATYSGTR